MPACGSPHNRVVYNLSFVATKVLNFCQLMQNKLHPVCPGNEFKMASPPIGAASKLFEPITIGNGKITLDHRVVFAPLTRNRGIPLSSESTLEKPNRIWLPSDLMVEYYSQRTSNGGLVITEGVPPSLEVCDFAFQFMMFQTRSSGSRSHCAENITPI
jgi:hypothetical protein